VAHQRKITVIGLGYVDLLWRLPLRDRVPSSGFDVDRKRIQELQASFDRTREVEGSDLSHPTLRYVSEPETLRQADFFIVTVPTPIDASRRPGLTAIYGASEMIGRFLRKMLPGNPLLPRPAMHRIRGAVRVWRGRDPLVT
jgi:UDP-N-acetyl-D-galactosamine dehydrogenase